MEVLKPPTDTLYKFVAILGLLLFVSSILTPIWLQRSLDEQEVQLLHDLTVLNLDGEVWEDDVKELQKLSKEVQDTHERIRTMLPEAEQGKIPANKVREELKKSRAASETYETMSKKFHTSILDWKKQNAQVDHKVHLFAISEYTTRRTLTLTSIGAGVGLCMTVFGFVLWYKRTQKWEDRLLKNKAQD